MNHSNKPQPRNALTPAVVKAVNVAWNSPDRPLVAVRHSAEFQGWCRANGLEPTKKRVAKFLRIKAAMQLEMARERMRAPRFISVGGR